MLCNSNITSLDVSAFIPTNRHQLNYGTASIGTSSIVVTQGVNTMATCDNGSHELGEPIRSVTLGSRRFSISLEISVAEILVVTDSDSQWQ